jgi:hypothetical protein
MLAGDVALNFCTSNGPGSAAKAFRHQPEMPARAPG